MLKNHRKQNCAHTVNLCVSGLDKSPCMGIDGCPEGEGRRSSSISRCRSFQPTSACACLWMCPLFLIHRGPSVWECPPKHKQQLLLWVTSSMSDVSTCITTVHVYLGPFRSLKKVFVVCNWSFGLTLCCTELRSGWLPICVAQGKYKSSSDRIIYHIYLQKICECEVFL